MAFLPVLLAVTISLLVPLLILGVIINRKLKQFHNNREQLSHIISDLVDSISVIENCLSKLNKKSINVEEGLNDKIIAAKVLSDKLEHCIAAYNSVSNSNTINNNTIDLEENYDSRYSNYQY